MLCSTHKWRRCADSFMRGTVPERMRVWRELCEAHGLDPDVNSTIDGAGRVFEKAPTGL